MTGEELIGLQQLVTRVPVSNQVLGFAWAAPLLQPAWRIQPTNAVMLFLVFWLVAGFLGLVEAAGFGKIGNAAHLSGLLCGLALGLVFGMTLASLTVALDPAPLWPLIGVFATFTIAQIIEGTVLTPKLVGDQIGLHPVIVIFAIAAGGQLFGFFGILLALPAAAVLSVLSRFAYDRYLKEHPEVVEQLEAGQAMQPDDQ